MSTDRLNNPVKTLEIGGTTCRIGKLTVGAAIEIEDHLSAYPSMFDTLKDSDILGQVSTDLAEKLINEKLQELHFWPPDAITALCDIRFLKRGNFSHAFLSAMIRAYNPHFSPDEVASIANKATAENVFDLQMISLGVTSDPKDESVPIATRNHPKKESTGAELSHG